MAMEMDGSGVVTATYLRGTYLYAAKTRDSNIGTTSSYKYYLYNGHGDTVQLLNTTGAVLWKYDCDAFGNLLTTLNAQDINPYLYCAEYYDRETKAVYLRARYYDPAIGRFTQQDAWEYADPKNPLSLNLYTYCKDSPVIHNDASGNFPVPIIFGGALLIYGLVTYYTSGQAMYNYNAMVANPNWYTIGNWPTVGMFDMVKGTFKPEKAFSFQHWLDSFGTAMLVLPFIQMGSNYATNKQTYNNIVFGSDTKSATKLSSQMLNRGWSEGAVREVVNNPYTTRVSTNMATGNPATAYYNKSGSYVIIDDITKAVVQLSDKFNPSSWIPDPNIINPYRPK